MAPSRSKQTQWKLLDKAAARINPIAIDNYLELRRLLVSKSPAHRKHFRRAFSTFYRLQIGGLTEAFKDRYFELLFRHAPGSDQDPYTSILLALYEVRRRQGDRSIQASFASKLVAIHDESRPIFDRHVSHFFGISVPSLGSPEFRIARFVENLAIIRSRYDEWSADPKFKTIVTKARQVNPRILECHPNRICDFLVWTIGNQKLE